MTYRVLHAAQPEALDLNSHNPAWQAAEIATVAHFLPQSSDHHPQTHVRVLRDGRGLHGLFTVRDRYVRCVRTTYGSEVWKDSCVEFFVEPKPGRGYFNFEFNCGGAFLCNHVTDPARVNGGLKQATPLPKDMAQHVRVQALLPRLVEPEITDPVGWELQFFIPFTVLEEFIGALGNVRGQTWRGNFFKCAEDNSHPHWAAWSPVDEFNFHLPRCFGELQFV